MKRFALIATLLVAAGTAWALLMGRFTSWTDLIEQSPDIIIARCVATHDGLKPGPTKSDYVNAFFSDIEVISVLKGTNRPGPSHLTSPDRPFRGELFLLFANYASNQDDTEYEAVEDYRVIPIVAGPNRWLTNQLAGKSLNEQVQMIINWRLSELNHEMERDNEEMARLKLNLNSNAPPLPLPPLKNGTTF
jgi:hypothetical protein